MSRARPVTIMNLYLFRACPSSSSPCVYTALYTLVPGCNPESLGVKMLGLVRDRGAACGLNDSQS